MADGDINQMKHRVTEVYDAYRYRACRSCVVDRFNGGKTGGISHYDSAYLRLQDLWATTLMGLRGAGWSRVQGDKRAA